MTPGMSEVEADSIEREVVRLRERCRKLEEALQRFAAMHREGCDLNEIALSRGYSSDLTILTSADFANAAALLNEKP